jgi:thioredoxin-related protein
MLMIMNNVEGFMQRRAILGVLAGFLVIGTLLTLSSKLKVDSQTNANSDFAWNDNWNNNDNSNNTPDVKPEPEQPAPVKQLIAASYQEALEMSAEKGMPILIIFHGSKCSYCDKMKREVLPNEQVKMMMKNYIYLSISTDQRAGQRIASKYGLRYIPAFAITNSKENKLKFEEKYMDADQLIRWLNNPNMFQQPQNDNNIDPQPEPEPDRIPDRRPG